MGAQVYEWFMRMPGKLPTLVRIQVLCCIPLSPMISYLMSVLNKGVHVWKIFFYNECKSKSLQIGTELMNQQTLKVISRHQQAQKNSSKLFLNVIKCFFGHWKQTGTLGPFVAKSLAMKSSEKKMPQGERWISCKRGWASILVWQAPSAKLSGCLKYDVIESQNWTDTHRLGTAADTWGTLLKSLERVRWMYIRNRRCYRRMRWRRS